MFFFGQFVSSSLHGCQNADQKKLVTTYLVISLDSNHIAMTSYENDPFYLRYEEKASACAVIAHAAVT